MNDRIGNTTCSRPTRRLPLPRRGSVAALILLVVAGLAAGCSTRARSDFRFRPPDHQAPRLRLEGYKSPEGRPGEQDRDRHVVVAISGGGHRAGNFGIGVMLALEALSCEGGSDALKEIDTLSTVSGGGFAAGAYLSSLYDHLAPGDDGRPTRGRDSYRLSEALEVVDQEGDTLRRHLERGYNGRAAKAFARLRAIFTPLDRGDYLEDALDKFLLGARERGWSLRLREAWIPKGSERPVLLPSWVANATVYENGAIFPITPDVLREYGVASYTHAKRGPIALHPGEEAELPLAVAMKASASFPGLLPATTFGIEGRDAENPHLHLLDGGLSDNLGLLTAVSVLENVEAPGKKVLILIDAFNSGFEPFSRKEGSPKWFQALFRSSSISLGSWHTRHQWVGRQLVRSLSDTAGPITLSFDDLLREGGAAARELFDRVREIKTEINIEPEEQADLFEAGRLVVATKREELCAAVFPPG